MAAVDPLFISQISSPKNLLKGIILYFPTFNYFQNTHRKVSDQYMSSTQLPSEMDLYSKPRNNDCVRQMRSEKQLDRYNFELDSPLFRKACHNLGVDPKDCIKKNYESFKEKGVPQDIVELRWKHYRSRMMQTMNEVLEERQRLKRNQREERGYGSPSMNSMDNTVNLQTKSVYNTLQNYTRTSLNPNRSVFSLKGAAFKSPMSLTRTHFSIQDLSELTDARLQDEFNKLQDIKRKYLHDTKRVLDDQERKKILQEKFQNKIEKISKSQQKIRKNEAKKFEEFNQKREKVKQSLEHRDKLERKEAEREEQRIIKENEKQAQKLEMLHQMKLQEIQKRQQEYTQKRNQVLKKIKSKNRLEVINSIQQMSEIEETIGHRRLKHDAILSEISMEVRTKNIQREIQTNKFKEFQEQKEFEERSSLERQIYETNLKLAKKGKQAMKQLRNVKQKHQQREQNFGNNKEKEDQIWHEKVEQLNQKFEKAKQNANDAQDKRIYESELRKEMKRLREEEIKKTQERQKKKAMNKKMEILEKDGIVKENLTNLKHSDTVLSQMKTNLFQQFQKEKSTFLTQITKIAHDQNLKQKQKKKQLQQLLTP